MKTLTLLLGGALALAACHPERAYLVKDGIVGPHGEKLTELECLRIEGCYEVAREQCGGPFDVASASAPVFEGSTTNQVLLYSCAPERRPRAAAAAATDPGAR
ncbi:MAG: hypothetical protein JWP97_4043 [Labilithrix sp.]|nr:hypothetical protein [Labilithrix sp.]